MIAPKFTVDKDTISPYFEGQLGGGLTRALRAAALESGQMVASLAKANAVVGATGHMRQGIAVSETSSGGYPAVIVAPSALYGGVVEFGRKPGAWPPAGALTLWMERKGIDPKLEYVIRRKIGKKGTKAQPFLVPALDKATPTILRIYARRVTEAA